MILRMLPFLLAIVTATSNVVKLQKATITGATLENHYAFRGIPYAKAPTGKNRFNPPIPSSTLTGILTMKNFGPSCWQFTPDKSKISTPESEDCLSINVYVPKTPSVPGPLKVLVWVHGGSNKSGSSSNPAENMDNFPSDLIKVSFNYRLGAFGFLPGVQGFTDRNAGLLDQKLAFEWVKQNIACFGGNPEKITAIGESAGANSIHSHMVALNGTQNLFSRAILISPPILLLPFNKEAESKKREAIRKSVNCAYPQGPDCLWAAPASLYASNATGFFYVPTVDPNYLQQDAFSAYSKKMFSKIPTLIHINKDEGSVFGLVGTGAEAKMLRRHQFPFFTEAMHQKFDTMYPYSGPQTGGDLFGDILFHCPASRLAMDHTASGAQMYMTYNTHKNYFRPFGNSIPPSIDIGVAHTSEMPHLFQLQSQIGKNETIFSKRVRDTFLNFARGSPIQLYGTARNQLDLEKAGYINDGRKDATCGVIQGFLNQILTGITSRIAAPPVVQANDKFIQIGEILTNMKDVINFNNKNQK